MAKCESEEMPRARRMAVMILREGRVEFLVAYDPREGEVHVGMAALRGKFDGERLIRTDGGRPLDVFEGAILEKVAKRLSLGAVAHPAPPIVMDPHVMILFLNEGDDPEAEAKKLPFKCELVPMDGNRELYEELTLRHVPQYLENLGVVAVSVTSLERCSIQVVHRKHGGGFELRDQIVRLVRHVCPLHEPRPETLS